MAAVADGRVAVQHRRFLGGRDEVRHRSAQAALDLLRQLLLRLQQQEQEPTPAS
jgi:nicotinamide mononucleotide (NMN) deamidase PncC